MFKHLPFSPYVKPFTFSFICLTLFLLVSPAPVAAYIPTGYQEYYVVGYEEHLWRMYMAISTDPDATEITSGRICSTVSLVATADYQVIYYDHWEDGYESDLFNPIQSTTEVYGDGDTGNGGTGTDVLVAGDDISLVSANDEDTINGYVPVNPVRDPAQRRYDGGDRILSTGGPVALGHAVWPYNGSWVGDAFEIYSRQAQEGAYAYRLPLGEDLYTFGGGDTGVYGDYSDLRDAYLQLQAFEDNTTVLIDNGIQAVNMTLNRGEIYSSMGYIGSSSYASLTINSGTHVHSNKPTQAVLITGSDATNPGYQGRSFTVLSDRLWGSDYVVPVPSATNPYWGFYPAEIYLSNPNDFPITVSGYDRFAQSTFTISPTSFISAAVPYSQKRGGDVPEYTAARFTSPDGVFGVFVAGGSSDSNYDWGASGMPSRYLTRDYYVSWAPGAEDLSGNGSPVWVTPIEDDTVFFVDHNDTSGGLDGIVDETFVLDVLEQRRVFDDDNDNTGMHIWASSDFTVFWGEDPRAAGVASPYMDIGLTVLPAQRDWLAPMLALDKTVDPTILPYSGGTVTFTLVAQAINALISGVDVTDTLPANWSYVAGSTTIQYPDGSSSTPDPTISGQNLAWDLSTELDINQSLTVTFQAQTSTAGAYDNTAYDGFESNSYSGGSGWAGDWTEVNEADGAAAGRVQVVVSENGVTPPEGSYQLRLMNDQRRIYRVVDLSAFNTPILRFMRHYQVDVSDENFFLDISLDGSTWTQVRNWTNNSGDENAWIEEIVDLTAYRSATTYIRFNSRQADTMENGDWLYVDQVKVYEGGQLNVNRGEASGVESYSGALFNPTDEAVVYISPLRLTKEASLSQAEIGNTLHYTLSYQNTSATSSASNVVLRDSVPVRYVTFLSATGGGVFDPASGTVNWSLGTLAAGASGSVSFQVQVNSFVNDERVIQNVGRIDSDETVEARSNEVSTNIVAPEIELVKDGPTVAYSGERITYTLSYENSGRARATNVVMSDTLPVSATYVPGSLAIDTGSGWETRGSFDGSMLVIQPGVVSGTVEPGEAGTIRFSMDLDSGLNAGELIMNWAVYDRDLDHPRDTNLVVTRISDLLISKSAQQASVAPDGLITYTLSYRNTGAVAHDNIVLREPVPDYTHFVGASTPAGLTLEYSDDNGQTWSATPPANVTHLRWLDASLASGEQETVSFWVRVNSTLLPNTTIRNIATISSTRVMATVREPIPSNQVEVPTADLWVTKAVAQSSATAGTAISYTISYGNRGSASVSNVQILDTLPSGANYVAGSIWGTGANAGGAPNLAWNVGTVAAGGGTQQVGYAARLDSNLDPGSQVINTAGISSIHGVKTSLPVTTTVTTAADLRVTKSDLIDPVQAGRTLTYTIAYTNAGPSDARDVTIVDTMPASATFNSVVSTNPSIPDPTQSGSTLTWQPGTVAAGASGTIVFSVLVDGLAPASLTNAVSIAGSTSESAPGDESDSETTAVTRTVSFQSASYSVDEDAGTASINVTLSSASPTPVSVRYATSNGTAIAPADYVTASGILNFPANTQVVAFTVPILGDALVEGNETVNLSLSDPAGVALASPTAAVLTILDGDDEIPSVSFSSASQSAMEGAGTMTIVAQLSIASAQAVTVPFEVSGSALAGVDYTLAASPIVIPGGSLSATLTLTLLDDGAYEADETVILTIVNPVNAERAEPYVHTATILDDDIMRATIYGVVFDDSNSNGIQDAGEDGIPGVTVAMDGTTITQTDALGNYTLDTTAAGPHTVVETDPTGYRSTTPNSVVVNVVLENSYQVNFGDIAETVVDQASLYGTVFDDHNNNGAQDSGEEGLGGVLMTLDNPLGSLVTTTTNLNGGYTFSTTVAGAHTVVETDPTGYRSTTPNTIVVNASLGESYQVDFGDIAETVVDQASIYGTVFDDRNGNGTRDAGEEGIEGVTVVLDGAVVLTTTSDIYGTYLFSTTMAGAYTVIETDMPGYRSTTPNTVVVNVSLGRSYQVDFGDVLESGNDDWASVYGTVFDDRNSNGLQDAGETGLAGVTVGLDGGATSTTNLNGGYTFSTTVAGAHSIVETDPAGYRSTTPNTVQLNVTLGESYQVDFGDIAETVIDQASIYGTVFDDRDGDGTQDAGEEGIQDVVITLDGTFSTTTNLHGGYTISTTVAGPHTVVETDPTGYRSTTPNTVVVNVSLGHSYQVNFGDVLESGNDDWASIYGTVFDDRNSNGLQDAGETGLAGVTVRLDGVRTSSTNLNGGYTFSTTVAGAHSVVETDPAGYRSTTPNTVVLNVTLGESYQVDFGDIAETVVDLVSIYGTVFNDQDGDGVQDTSEIGIPNVSIVLDGVVTATTNLNGSYTFSTTVAGAHTVVEIDPAGYRSTTPNTVQLYVTLGESYQVDFGDTTSTGYASILGTVYNDADGDGLQDVGEAGIAGVTVTLDSSVVATTNANGGYSFATSQAGAHSVVEADPVGYRSTTPNTVVLNVILGRSYQVDFGDIAETVVDLASIYGTVFNDQDGDGIQDASEAGIPNVSVVLDGAVTATTNAYGGYTFVTDVEGAHTVVEIDPAGFRSTTPNTVQLDVTLGESYQVDFGDTSSAGYASIFGTVFEDLNSNGLQEVGETGLPGVLLTLDGGATTTSNPNGGYTFATSQAGTHTVVESDPAGYRSTTPNTVTLNVAMGNSYQVDFGDIPETIATSATIYGTVFNDVDSDGIQDSDETGIQGVTITLDSDLVTFTGPYGGYTFSTTVAGLHTVVESDPDDYDSTTPNTVAVSVTLGNSYQVDFGDKPKPSAIYGFVFDDTNRNGIRDAGESGLENVTLTLDGGETTQTNVTGYYIFSPTLPGFHTVVETDPGGFRSTTPNTVTLEVRPNQSYPVNFGDVSTTEPYATIMGTVFDDKNINGAQDTDELGLANVTITLDSLLTVTTDAYGNYTFSTGQAGAHTVVETNPPGYRSTTPDVVTLDVEMNRSYQVDFGDVLSSTTDDRAIIYGTVFDDRDGNGVQSGAEPGIPFVTVMLDNYYVEVTTNPNGGYTFATGEPGPHTVAETNLGGYRSTTPDVVVVSVTLGSNFEVNFGDVLASDDSASLYGTVFDDRNGNGVQDDDETGLPNVLLTMDGVVTTLSNINGGYTFSTTVAGAHTVVETDPAGYRSTTPNTVVVSVTLHNSYRVDFGDVDDSAAFASIYGTVFDDKNGNGVQDDGETGLPNVVLTLDSSYAATSNANGGYTFATTQLGYHTVVEADPGGYRSTTPNRVVVNVTAYQDYQVDFGDVAESALFASIYGTVFDDKNGSGSQDADEAGLPGATLTLDGDASVTSNANGAYTFAIAQAGVHAVVETNPAGYRSTTPDIVVVNVEIGESYQVDFGDVLDSENSFANIYGTVFDDVDGDGVHDLDETGIAGVRITLDGNPVWTNAYGSYAFVVRAAGAHTLVETDPPGFRSTTPNTVRLDVALGNSYGVDFGDVSTGAPFASIYGTVFDDENGNGNQDSGEAGLAGVTLTLDDTLTTTTTLGGGYAFAVYDEGYHVVVETNPAGFRSTTPDRVVLSVAHGQSYELDFGDTQSSEFASVYGTVFLDKNSNGVQDDDEEGIPNVSVTLDSFNAWTDHNGTYTFVTQQPGPHIVVEKNLAGYRSTTPDRVVLNVELGNSYQVDFGDTRDTDSATIYGTVYNDNNGNGTQDAGETGLAGVTLTLDGSATATTNLNGGYTLSTTVVGAHTLVETDPGGYRSTTPNQVVLNVALGQSYQVDFGDVLTTANLANVYGTVFFDENSNGIQDAGENGIPNVSVTLDGASTVKTNSYGLYAFAAVAAGQHSVVETNPSGYRSTTPDTVQLEVMAGHSYQVDFGDVPINTSGSFATLYGTVYNDKNGNGVQEIGETGLAGVTITLDGITTTVTNLNGSYTLSTTVAGVHTLVETDLPGYRSTTPNTIVLDVLLGVSYQVDFGDIAETVTDLATLYGTVYNDNNSNGLHDPGEVGISNVEITLDGQTAIRTNAYGTYAFGIATAGTHILVETDPAGYRSTTSNMVVVSVTLGHSYEVDFGDVSQTQTDFATLYGTVYDDLDGDGIQDAGEPGLAGVTITLDSAVQALTNVYGGYTFSTTQGAHTLVETNPPGYRSTTPDVVQLDVALGDSYQVDFGDTTRSDLATVYGTVFNDLDGDGVQGAGETGIAGVTVRLDEEATTTNANGGYTFSTPEAGLHVLVQTNLPGYRSTTPDTLVISLTLGTSLEVNFGDVAGEIGRDWATIMGVVFDDRDSNGQQDADEMGLAGVTLTLDGSATATTDLNGSYTFSTTVAGPHTLVETNLPGYRSTTPDVVQLDVALGDSYQVNFGDVLADTGFATIYGTVFNDLDGDGIQDSGEVGLAGVTLTLDDTLTTTTNLNGGYTFSTTVTGVHLVVETDPPGYHSTTPNNIQLDVELGQSYQVDFGDTTSASYASIFGTVYRDLNANGLRDVGETGIEGVLITLSKPGGSTATAVTGVYGTYVFSTTLAGSHTIVETDPPGYLSTTPNERERSVVMGNSYEVNFGDRPSAIIVYGTVFEDNNGNGVQDDGEGGLAGVTVALDELITTTTDLSGTYMLTTTIPGAHTVVETDLGGYRSTTPNSVVLSATLGAGFEVNFGDVSTVITSFASIYGTVFNDRDSSGVQGPGETGLGGVLVTLDGSRPATTDMYGNYTFSTTVAGAHKVVETDPGGYRSTTPNSVVVSVTLGNSYQVDFGDVLESSSQWFANVYGTVFEDNDGDGAQDDDEPGLAGVTIRLDGPQGATATTNLNGGYALSTTVAGLYTVVESDLPGYRSTTPNSVVVSVTLGHSYQVDFGDVLTTSGSANIYGTVFNDDNSNGVQDQTETGIAGVALTLNGAVTATTDLYGGYSFSATTPGAYTLVEIDLPGYRSTTPNTVRLDVALGNGYQVDFGDVLTSTSGNFASLYGTVFNDNNGNGVQDAREVGIPNVTITLDGVVSTTTNVNGGYTFSTTTPGAHALVETDLPNYRSTTPNTVMLNVMLNNSYQADFGDVLSSISIGFATVYGTVFDDADGNGIQDMGEAGLAGVVLSLDELVTTTSNLLGGYTFSTTVAGPHAVVETDPPGYRSTTPNTVMLNVALNNSYQADFGDVSLSVPLPFASIFGTVFEDNNRNGTRDAGEVGLAGVSLTLDEAVAATTNINGGYTFSTTVIGMHTVVETDLPGYRSTTPNTVTQNVVMNTSYQADFGDVFVICDPDSSEDDDTPAAAKTLTLTHNFCEDASDWMTFEATAGAVYTLTTSAWGQRADTVLTLYDSDSRTSLAMSDDYEGSTDFSSRLVWSAPAAGLYYLQATSHGGVTGNATEYDIWLIEEQGPISYEYLYLPVILQNWGEIVTTVVSLTAEMLAPTGVITHTMPDAYEVDDTWQQAKAIEPGETQTRTFDSPTAALPGEAYRPDKDYVRFETYAGIPMTFTVLSWAGTTPTLALYDSDGNSPYQVGGHWLTGSLSLAWTPPAQQVYYIAASDAGATVPATYTLRMDRQPFSHMLYLPVILRSY